MNDRQTQSDDWISQWIARQRESLAQGAAHAHSAGDATPFDFVRRWMDAGQSYFDPLKSGGSKVDPSQAGASDSTFGDPFNIGNAMLGAWANAGLLQSSVADQTAEMFGRLPPIGLAREQTEAWRELAAAQAQYRQIENELRAVLLKVQYDALDLLNERIRRRGDEPPIDSFRTLYDLWVECGEQVYGKLAHSEAYASLQAALGNASMRLRTRLQTVIEHGLKQLDLPTRSELNTLHRQVRDLRVQIEQLTTPAQPKAKRATSSARVRKSARKPGRRR